MNVEKKLTQILCVLIVLTLAIVAGVGVSLARPGGAPVSPPVALGTTNFDSLELSDNLTVGGTAAITGATALNGGLTMDTNKFTVADTSGNTSIAGTLGVTGATTLTGPVIYSSTSLTATTTTLNPTHSFYKLTAAGTVTLTLGTSGITAGQLLILYETSSQNVVIADTNLYSSTGNALTLGQYDQAGFIFDGTKWVELFLLTDS